MSCLYLRYSAQLKRENCAVRATAGRPAAVQFYREMAAQIRPSQRIRIQQEVKIYVSITRTSKTDRITGRLQKDTGMYGNAVGQLHTGRSNENTEKSQPALLPAGKRQPERGMGQVFFPRLRSGNGDHMPRRYTHDKRDDAGRSRTENDKEDRSSG